MSEERYELTWPGKSEARLLADSPTDKRLVPIPERSVNWDTTGNLYIEGDNLDALKLLRNDLSGQVRLIYIDPPYNTGTNHIYHDDFSMTRDEYREVSKGSDGREDESSYEGRIHSRWLSMMLPRLMLARDLLSDDGSIFVSIDQNESARLRMLMSEVFGERNFQREIVWRMGWVSGFKSSARNFIRNHDTILLYSKDAPSMRFNKEYIENRDFKPLLKKTKELTGFLDGLGLSRDEQDELLDFVNHGNRPDRYPIEDTWNCNEYDDLNSIAIVSFSGEKVSKRLGVRQEFTGQKSVAMLRRVVRSVTEPHGRDIVLDFFSGSGSMAEAVMEQNAEDGGDRRFVMVQLPESDGLSMEAKEAGYHDICELAEERIRRAGESITDRLRKVGSDHTVDVGFKVYKVI